MLRWSSTLLLACIFLVTHAQDRATLEKERQGLLRQIEATNSLIQQSRKNQEATLSDIHTIQAEISLRGRVLQSLRSEIGVVESSVSLKEQTVEELQVRMDHLRTMHGAFLKQEYIQRRTENRAMFLLSASSLNEAYARWRYLRAFKTAREKTFASLSAASDSIRQEIAELETLRGEKQVLLSDVANQEEALAEAKGASENKLKALKSDESKLRRELDRQKKERDRLAAEIERIIKAEIAKTTTTNTGLPDAPELVALSAEFEQNKGKLPWPVDRGIITGKFGTQPHPVIPSIKIANNGIDITAPSGAEVKALFNGKVVGKKQIPGFDNTVIVQHGSYYTVYSRLATASVVLGDVVSTGQVIGQLSTGGANGKLHIEVWRDKTQLDPETWLKL